jgi:hypothetical protein
MGIAAAILLCQGPVGTGVSGRIRRPEGRGWHLSPFGADLVGLRRERRGVKNIA